MGGGDPRRFPQPKMAEFLDYSLRQYQRLENPEDQSLPDWGDLERIADKLDLDADKLFGGEDLQAPADDPTTTPTGLEALRSELGEVRDMVEELLRRSA